MASEKLKNGIKKISDGQKMLGREVRLRTSEYILAALGFVVGLAWNDAVKALIEDLFPLNKNSILVKFVYALMVTILIVAATVILTKRQAEVEEIKK